MVLLLSCEIKAPACSSRPSPLLFSSPSILPLLYSSSISCPLLRRWITTEPPGFSSNSQGLWMNARLSLRSNTSQCTGMQRDREEALNPSTPPLHLHLRHHHPALQAAAFPPHKEVLWGKASGDCCEPLPANVMKSLSVPPFLFCLMSKVGSFHQVNTWVMK